MDKRKYEENEALMSGPQKSKGCWRKRFVRILMGKNKRLVLSMKKLARKIVYCEN